jgi:hypothetical protein
MKRTTIPIYTQPHCNKCSFTNGTIGHILPKSQSSAWNAPPQGAWDEPAYSTPPEQILDWPLYGIKAASTSTFTDIHVEGPAIATWVPASYSPGAVTAHNIDGNFLSDPGRTVYYNDQRNWQAPPPLNTDYWGYATGILLTGGPPGPWPAYLNHLDSFRGSFKSHGNVTYLLRDEMFGKHISAFGWGQFPDTNNTSNISFYSRGDGYYVDGTGTNQLYNHLTPPTGVGKRDFFLGPVM